MFDKLHDAVIATHGSVHHAFLSWDRDGLGQLSRARVRVGLRGCRGASERDIESFSTLAFQNTDHLSFNQLYQALSKSNFPTSSPQDSLKSLPQSSSRTDDLTLGHSDHQVLAAPTSPFSTPVRIEPPCFSRKLDFSASATKATSFPAPPVRGLPPSTSPSQAPWANQAGMYPRSPHLDSTQRVDPVLKAELRATILAMSKTCVFTGEEMISPSDLRRSFHSVDPSLPRRDVVLLTERLMGHSHNKARVGSVLESLDSL